MTAEPAASVVIPTRGGRARLHFPLDALRNQTRSDFEVIVVIDGDIDDTLTLVQQYQADGFETLRVHRFEENQGRSRALNQGIEMARGRVIIRCDDDLEPRPDFVDRHIHAHRGRDLSAVVGLTTNIFPDGAYAQAYGRPANDAFIAEARRSSPDTHWKFWAANCSATRAAYQRVGGYDEAYRRYGWEDVDMGYRLAASGMSVRIDPSLTAKHHGPALTAEGRTLRSLHSGAAREIFVLTHGGEALGPPHKPGGPWGWAVRSLATVMTEPVARAVSRLVDRLLPVLPATLGRKLVALCVEAAGLSGIRHPGRARTTF
ncbi:glycosyltransferase family 2 protein [Kocuria sp. HSID16901]|uniref:glycosyltransferase family 2 protein n=1 Tax=Kocuria sp. HSID16901 TaxID=2419505 RepID=UPI0006601510|nr:glycosyltransferase family 2 protein [Kocuria sp. HSID16901]